MSTQTTGNGSTKRRRTPIEIAQFAVEVPALPVLVAVAPASRTKVARKVVVKLIEKVKGL